MAAVSTQVKTFRGGTITASDGTGTPVTLIVPVTKGDTAIGPIREYLNELVIITARSEIVSLAEGAPSIPTITFTAWCGNLIGSDAVAPGSFLEFGSGRGAYAANISTLGTGRTMTFDLRMQIRGIAWGDTANETIDCEDVVGEWNWNEAGDGNVLTFSGQILGDIVITNNTNVVTYAQAT